MGISGLLQFLKDASEPVHVKKYRGQTVAVDTYCWLHKGAFSCAEKLAKGEPTEQYVWYCMKFVDMLLSFGVKPILVFDGCNLPSKREVDKARRERRQANLQKGKQLLREGKLSEARDCFTKSVSVTPSMAHDVIKAARAKGVDCVVAPYEADAQLAYLSKSGMAQAIITEDSDLLAFGCKKVILKMDKEGNGLEIDQNNLGRCRSLGDVFTEQKFRHMCILSGCDYLASLYGIGLGKACKLLKMANNPDILRVIKKMGQYLKMNLEVPEEYIEGFVKAENTFLYQLVFDPVGRKVVPLNRYPEHIDPASLSYAGHNIGDEKGLQMALGNLDIHTMEMIDDFNPDKPNAQTAKPRSHSWNNRPEPSAQLSIWSRGYTPGSAASTPGSATSTPGSAASTRPAPGSPKTPPSTRGKERVITLQGLRLPSRDRQVKRPRDDSSLSDQDVLQQYSASSQKRVKSQEHVTTKDTPTPSTRPSDVCTPGSGKAKPRNCFATLLQRRNQDAEGDSQVTRSRFFSSSSEVISQSTTAQQEVSQDVVGRALSQNDKTSHRDGEDLQDDEEDAPEVPSVDTPSPSPPPTPTPPSPSASPSPKPASQGVGVFRWSGTSTEQSRTPVPVTGLAALQQFHRQKPGQKPLLAPSPPARSPVDLHPEDKGTPPDSPPSQDSAYFSQPGLTSCHKEEVLAYSCSPVMTPTPSTDAIFEISSSNGSDTDQSPTNYSEEEHKPSLMKAKVQGLPRLNRSDQGKATKIQPSGTARASGLRKKPSGPGKKAQSNNENNPGLQSTITGLWKNFSFKRENPRMNPREKADPLSPVKDNLLAPTPEKEKDVYFVSSTNKIKCL